MREQITGAAAAPYIQAWMCSATPNHHGLNGRALTRDALNACRNPKARRRLSLASATRRMRPVPTLAVVSPWARASARPPVARRVAAPSASERGKPRLAVVV